MNYKDMMFRYYQYKTKITLDIQLEHYEDALKKIFILQNKKEKSVLEENFCYRASAVIYNKTGNKDLAKECINNAITLMDNKEGLEEYNMARMCNYAYYKEIYSDELTEDKRKIIDELIEENKNKNRKVVI